MKRPTLLISLALAGTLALAGCGGDNSGGGMDHGSMSMSASGSVSASPSARATSSSAASGEPVTKEHNDQDVMFARMMTPHHQQAVTMSETLLAKDNVPTEVRSYAQEVIDAQGPEIQRMNAMLAAWGQDPGHSPSDMPGMDASSGSGMDGMSGMMSEKDMNALDQAKGAEAAALYLKQMTTHHQGAIDMAKKQVEHGKNPQAVGLAEHVVSAQEAEIKQMKNMLGQLAG